MLQRYRQLGVYHVCESGPPPEGLHRRADTSWTLLVALRPCMLEIPHAKLIDSRFTGKVDLLRHDVDSTSPPD